MALTLKKEQDTKSKKVNTEVTNRSVYAAASVIVALLLFASGWAFGRGNIGITSLSSGAVRGNIQNFNEVNEVVKALRDNYDGAIDDTKLMDSLKSGAAKSAGDPYTEFFNSEDSKAFSDELSGSFEGIGAELGKDGNNIVIITPIAGSPAEKAGLKSKDIIVKIDDTQATDMSIAEAVKLIRGKAGTDVKLTLARDGNKVELTITRGKISIPSVKWEIKDGICTITLSRFGEDTASLMQKAATECRDANVRGVILDMRGNPGGLLDAAVKVSSLWLDNGKVVLLEKRGGKVEKTFKASGAPTLKGIKTAVLINGGSASASEITAGALHDNEVATLIGETSYGKGSVQQIIDLSAGGTLKVTIARWFTPNDKNIDKEGIKPDQEVKISDQDIKNGVDPQIDAAKAYLK
ncbi:S41 family peptidase [bacterium]|nr:S41 family peptidase [bacterium]NBX97868.1 S41 family peptidase [bacterium]